MVFRSQKLRVVMHSRFSTSLLVCAVCLVLCVLANQSSKNADAKSSVPPNTTIQATPTPTPPPYLFTIRVQEVAYLTGVYPQLANSSWSYTKTENGETWNWSGTVTGNSITLNTSATSSTSTIRRVGAGAFHIVEIFSLANQPAQISVSGSASLNINVASVLPWHNRSSALYFPQGFLTGEQNYQIELQGVGSLTGGSSFAAGPNTYNPTGDAYFPEYPGLTYHKIFSGAVGSGLGTTSGYTGSISASGSTTITLPVTNQPPIAVIDGPKYNSQYTSTFYTGDRVTLSSLSYDPDNTPNATPLPGAGINAYQWTVTPPAVNGQPAPTPILFNTQNIEFVCSNAGTYNVQLIVTDDEGTQSTPVSKSIEVKQPAVISISFKEKNSPLTPNPLIVSRSLSGTLGQRIFPDKTTPGDTVNRKIVKVQAVVDARDGTPVHFKSFDVDDPSSHKPPIDFTDQVDTTLNLAEKGNDNKGQIEGQINGKLSASTAFVSSTVAEVEFTVTLQPGDNFVVAASLSASYLSGCVAEGSVTQGFGVKDVIGNDLPTNGAEVTDILTVWRNVHIEVDSMGNVENNLAIGSIRQANFVPGKNETILIIDQGYWPNQTDNPWADEDRFINGQILIDGVGRFGVKEVNSPRIVVYGKVERETAKDKSFKLYDDDDFNHDDDLAKDGDYLEDVASSKLLELLQESDDPDNNVFAPAFIRPKYDIGDNNSHVPFFLNSPEQSLITSTYDFDYMSNEANNEFWTVYLLGAYQYIATEDNDPDTEGATAGIVDDINGIGANVFLESCQEYSFLSEKFFGVIAAHEIGHLFNGKHTDVDASNTAALMSIIDGQSPIILYFNDITLNKIRAILHP